jgi:hypothetical protein
MPDNMKSFFSMKTHKHLTMNIKVLFGLIRKEVFFRYTVFAPPFFCEITIHPKEEVVELIFMMAQNTGAYRVRITKRSKT